ncbi:MAG: septum formation initiator family protein [Clostridia bacterium]|nr:septum formation initiator family protein [Clostridia bacterium]
MAKEKKRRFSFILAVLFISVAVIFVVSLVAVNKEIKEHKAEVEQLESQCEAQEAENDELQSMVDSGNQDEYIEKIAREKYGYIEQGDRVYQDIASGE